MGSRLHFIHYELVSEQGRLAEWRTGKLLNLPFNWSDKQWIKKRWPSDGQGPHGRSPSDPDSGNSGQRFWQSSRVLCHQYLPTRDSSEGIFLNHGLRLLGQADTSQWGAWYGKQFFLLTAKAWKLGRWRYDLQNSWVCNPQWFKATSWTDFLTFYLSRWKK